MVSIITANCLIKIRFNAFYEKLIIVKKCYYDSSKTDILRLRAIIMTQSKRKCYKISHQSKLKCPVF